MIRKYQSLRRHNKRFDYKTVGANRREIAIRNSTNNGGRMRTLAHTESINRSGGLTEWFPSLSTHRATHALVGLPTRSRGARSSAGKRGPRRAPWRARLRRPRPAPATLRPRRRRIPAAAPPVGTLNPPPAAWGRAFPAASPRRIRAAPARAGLCWTGPHAKPRPPPASGPTAKGPTRPFAPRRHRKLPSRAGEAREARRIPRGQGIRWRKDGRRRLRRIQLHV